MRAVCVVMLCLATGWAPVQAGDLTIVDPLGEPVAGARIGLWAVPRTGSLIERIDPLLGEAESDADGRVSLSAPRARSLVLVVDHADFAPLLVEAEASLPPRLTLSAGSVLRGRALPRTEGTRETGTKARGEATALPAGEACAHWTTHIPALGRTLSWRRCGAVSSGGGFSISGVGDEVVELTVKVSGYLPVHLRAAGVGDPARIELDRGVQVTGRVLGPRGTAMAGALVRATPEIAVETDAAGVFRLAVPRLPVELTSEAAGYLPARLHLAPGNAVSDVVLQLEKGQLVTGDLVGDGGLPIRKATFWAHRWVEELGWTTARHDEELADGGFRLLLGEPGRYRISAAARGYRETALGEIEIESGQELDLGSHFLARGAGARGTLVDELTGEPVAGATVEAIRRGDQLVQQALRGALPRAVSEETGAFELMGLEAGGYELRVELEGYAPVLRELDLEQDRIEEVGEIVLGRGVLLHGRVKDRGGRPRAGARVAFYRGAGDSSLPAGERRSDGEGRFEGPSLSPGQYVVRVERDRLLLVQGVEVPEGVEEHELELTAGGVALGGVVTETGMPVAGGFLTLTSRHDPGLRRGVVLLNTGGALDPAQRRLRGPASELVAEVGPDGTFTVEDAPPGDLWVTFYGLSGRQVTRVVHVPDQDQAWVVVELDGVELAGTTLDGVAEVAVEASVRLVSPAGQVVATTVSDPTGRFELAGLEPGSYRLEVTAPGYQAFVDGNVQVEPGAEPVVIRLEPGDTGALTVQLFRTDGSPMARVQFTLLDASGVMVRSLLSDGQGEKLFRGLPAGEYFVVWSDVLAGTGSTSQPVRVAAGERAFFRAHLPPASPVSLRCEPAQCGGRGLHHLQVLAPGGLELTPYLAGTYAGARFSESGHLALGRLSPGQYLVRAAAAGIQAEQLLQVQGAEAVVVLQ